VTSGSCTELIAVASERGQ